MTPGRLLLACALLAAALSPSAAHEPARGQDTGTEVEARIRAILRAAGPTEAEERGAGIEIGRLGESVILPLFELFRAEPWLADDSPEAPRAGRLTLRHRGILLEAVRRLHPQLLAFVRERRESGGLSPRDRQDLLRLLAEVGADSDLELVFRLATDEPPIPRIDRLSRLALGSILRRGGPAAFREARRLWFQDGFADSQKELLEAIELAADPEGLRTLVDLVGTVAGQDVELLRRIASLSETLPSVPGDLRLTGIRILLDPASPEGCARAARCLGRLGGSEDVPDLIELLDSEDDRIRQSALEALQSLGGCRLPEDSERWWAWHEAEQTWWDEVGSTTSEDLRAAEAVDQVRAVTALLRHPLFFRECVPELADVVRNGALEARIAACRALAQLREGRSIPALIDALEDEEDTVRAAAHRALMAITGETLPPRPRPWRARFEHAL